MRTFILKRMLICFFDDGDSTKAFAQVKKILQCRDIASIGPLTVGLMELLQLGKIEKGSLLPDGKYQSIAQ